MKRLLIKGLAAYNTMSNKQNDVWMEQRLQWIAERNGFTTLSDEKGEYIEVYSGDGTDVEKQYLPDNLQYGYEDTRNS